MKLRLSLFLVCTAYIQLLFSVNYTVTNTNDAGVGSLREAMANAISNPGTDNVIFNIPGAAPHTITLTSALPALAGINAEATNIAGFTQPANGYTGPGAKIIINGNNLMEDGIVIESNDCLLYGLDIRNFSKNGVNKGSGVYILGQSSSNKIQNITVRNCFVSSNERHGIFMSNALNTEILNNFIGVDSAGLVDRGNGEYGIYNIRSDNSDIERNLVSGNGESGIMISSSDGVTIVSNKIGTNHDASAAIGNDEYGIIVTSSSDGTAIGNTNSGKGNIISGNNGDGVIISNFSTNTSIINNYIGVDSTGSFAISNADNGVRVSNFSEDTYIDANVISGNGLSGIRAQNDASNILIFGNVIGTNPTATFAIGNGGSGILVNSIASDFQIGDDLVTARGNIISGNDGDGISVTPYSDDLILGNKIIKGNKIGTDYTETLDLGNGWNGISLRGRSGFTIGGVDDAENVIVNNVNNGIEFGSYCSFYNVYGNYIGTNSTTTADMGNGGSGIFFTSNGTSVDSNHIGNSDGTGINYIAFNSEHGIYMEDVTTEHNAIRRNSIYNNGMKGIELNNESNEDYPFPRFTNVTSTLIEGKANPGDSVELFYNHSGNNFSQGETYIGTAITDVNGDWSYIGVVTDSCNIIATATSTENNTSEFSPVMVDAELFVSDTIICLGDSVILDAVTDASNLDYAWIIEGNIDSILGTDSTITVFPRGSGIYTLLPIQVSFCTLNEIEIEVIDLEELDWLNDTTICQDSTIQLGNMISGANYSWSTGENTPFIEVSEPGDYTLTIQQSGCEASRSFSIDTTNCDTILIIPTTPTDQDHFLFVPNAIALGASVNNTLRLISSGIEEIAFSLYNRRGEKVWFAQNIGQVWDPVKQNQNYNQTLTYYISGSFLNGEVIEQSGTIQVLK